MKTYKCGCVGEAFQFCSLHAAAPRLLAMAKAVIGFADGWAMQDALTAEEQDERDELQAICDGLRQAIALAEGKRLSKGV